MTEPWSYFCECVSVIFIHILIIYATLVYTKSKKSHLNHFQIKKNQESNSVNQWVILLRIFIANLISMRQEMTEP